MNFFQKIVSTFRQQRRLAQLIIINVSVFLVLNKHLLGLAQVYDYLALPIGGTDFLKRIWTIFTYMFSHQEFGHVFFNMLLFYFTAQLFFRILGEKKLFYVYVMSGLVGGAFLLLCGLIFPGSFSHSTLIGASAAVMGVVMVIAVYEPNYSISLWDIIKMPYKYFAVFAFITSTIIDFSLNTGGKISHIGGAIFGLTYGYGLKKGTDLFNFSFLTKKKKKVKILAPNETIDDVYNTNRKNSELRMNELLDKISKSGYNSLSKREKDELFNLSQKK